MVERHTVERQGDCEELCKGNDSCVYFSYSSIHKVCLLFEKCETLVMAPGAISSAKACKSDRDVKSILYVSRKFYRGRGFRHKATLISLVTPNSTCILPHFRYWEWGTIVYLGYLDTANTLVACVRDRNMDSRIDCLGFDIDTSYPLPSSHKIPCGDPEAEHFLATEQGLVVVKTMHYHQGECKQEMVSEIFNGVEWTEISVEEVITEVIKQEDIKDSDPAKIFFAPLNSSEPTLCMFTRGEYHFWTLDFEANKWTKAQVESTGTLYWVLNKLMNQNGSMVYHREEERYLVWNRFRNVKQVHTMDLKGRYALLEGVQLPTDPLREDLATLVPSSFSMSGCYEEDYEKDYENYY